MGEVIDLPFKKLLIRQKKDRHKYSDYREELLEAIIPIRIPPHEDITCEYCGTIIKRSLWKQGTSASFWCHPGTHLHGPYELDGKHCNHYMNESTWVREE